MEARYTKTMALTLDSGRVVNCSRIGRGRFSEAWRHGNSVYLLCRPTKWGADYSKEILSRLSCPHFPRVERLGYLGNSDICVYKEPYYSPLTSKDKPAWAVFRVLASVRDDVWSRLNRQRVFNPMKPSTAITGERFNREFLSTIKGLVPSSVFRCLSMLADTALDYGNGYMMEFTKRNCAVSRSGRLIFLDVLFNAEAVQAEMNYRTKTARGW